MSDQDAPAVLTDAIRDRLDMGAHDGIVSEPDLARINDRAGSNAHMSAGDIYVTPGVMANNNLSSYSLRMGESSLRNFATDADRGTPFHSMHERLHRNVGHTFAGYYDPVAKEARTAIVIGRNRPITDGANRFNSNDTIEDISKGVRPYLSVGAGGPNVRMMCDLCGKDVYDWYTDDPCYHLPGYKAENGENATATVEHAHLVELSHVDAGAIPGSMMGRPHREGGKLLWAPDWAYDPTNPVQTNAHGQLLQFMVRLSDKAYAMQAGGRVPLPAFREWLDYRGLPDPTRHFSTSATRTSSRNSAPNPQSAGSARSGRGKGDSMDPELLAALARYGIALPANWNELSTDAKASQVKASLDAAVAAAIESNPLLKTAYAAGIKSADAFLELQREAENGKVFDSVVNQELERQAVRNFGQGDRAKRRFDAAKNLPLEDKREIAIEWCNEANEKLNVGRNGEAARRLTASDPVQTARPAERAPERPVSRPTFAVSQSDMAGTGPEDEEQQRRKEQQDRIAARARRIAGQRYPTAPGLAANQQRANV